MAQLNFDANTVKPQEAMEAIPAGWYNVQIVASEMKSNSANDGAYLQLQMQIMDGQYASRKLSDRLNLQNKNQMAMEIAYSTLSAICHATGVIQVQDSQQLHGHPLQAKVSLRPAGPGSDGKMYDASNEIKGYRKIEGMAQAAPQWAPAMQQAPQVAPAQPQMAAPAAMPAWSAAPPPAAEPVQAAPQFQQPAVGVGAVVAGATPAAPMPPWMTAPAS